MCTLFVVNYSAETGYAWSTIEAVFRGVGQRLKLDGGRVAVCYSELPHGPPASMRGSGFAIFEFDYLNIRSPLSAFSFARLLHRHEVRVLYLTDQPTWSPYYPLFRASGVRCIIVHDRNSGTRTSGLLTRLIKRFIHRIPWLAADIFVAVSVFVRNRLVAINGTPPHRTAVVHNGIDISRFRDSDPNYLRSALDIPAERPVLFFSGRMQGYKGIHVLIDAAAQLQRTSAFSPILVLCGDGPALRDLVALGSEHPILDCRFLGRRDDVHRLLPGATVAVVPSLWEEAFGLTVVEAMAAGVPVVASAVGGIPELVVDGESGILVPPNNPGALAAAIHRLLEDDQLRFDLSAAGQSRARDKFNIDRTIQELYAIVRSPTPPFGQAVNPLPPSH